MNGYYSTYLTVRRTRRALSALIALKMPMKLRMLTSLPTNVAILKSAMLTTTIVKSTNQTKTSNIKFVNNNYTNNMQSFLPIQRNSTPISTDCTLSLITKLV